ncbi:MAG: hypothetical protein J7K75_07160 [Desulfuromonas sp.]|nr:hypothetical protein [Desulfuromonas sp.]
MTTFDSEQDNDLFSLEAIQQQLLPIQASSGRKKYQLLLEAPNSAALVQCLPPQELFLLVKELGVLDVPDLIGMASPEQVTLCVDMDCWQGDELDAEDSLLWLQLLLIQDEEAFLRLIDGFDFELLVMMVKKQLTITGGLESLGDDEDLMANRKRFDQVYECDYRNSDVAKVMDLFQDVLFRERQEFFLRLMEAVRHEFDSALQEDVFVLRRGRLADLGFVESFEARSLYSTIDPDSFNPEHYLKPAGIYSSETMVSAAPGFMTTTVVPRDLLADVMAGGMTPDLCHELSFLLNRAMSADQVDYGEPDEIRQALGDVYHYLNIALGHLAGSDVEQAAQLFRSVYLQSLYQLGFSLTVELRQRAEKIKTSSIGPYLDGPDTAVITALCQPKPRFFNGINDATRADQRSFFTWAELVMVQAELECIEGLHNLFGPQGLFDLPQLEQLDLQGCFPDHGNEVTLSELFLTALANRLMGRDFDPQPFPVQELLTLQNKINQDGEGLVALREQTQRWLEQQAPGTGGFAGFCLDIWQHELCELQPTELTAEYVGGLIIRL